MQEKEKLYKTCLRCHRKLKSEENRKRGYGDICWKRIQANKKRIKPLFMIGLLILLHTVPVKAEVVHNINYEEYELLLKVVEAEAGNQGIYGKQLVADVILNRVDDTDFPDNITDVVYQDGQFACIHKLDSIVITQETIEAVIYELHNEQNMDILFFSSTHYNGPHPWQKVKDHYFSCK